MVVRARDHRARRLPRRLRPEPGVHRHRRRSRLHPFGGPATIRVTETLGRLGEADYLIYQPEDWNGDLVLWAHQFLPTLYPAGAFPFPVPVGFGPYPAESDSFFQAFLHPRDATVCHGFAMAAAAFESHGPAVEEGMHDTHLLNQIAHRHLGAEPQATYLTGYSGGGLITIALAERFPHRYAGALADQATASMSVAGNTFCHIRAVLDVSFPGLIDTPLFQGRDLTPDDLNARVPRYDADDWAVRNCTFFYEPSGELQLPLVSIRVSHNPMVPIELGWAYDQAVARAGATDLHSVWRIERCGHNTLTAQEFATALLALAEWVDTGTRPTWPTAP